MYDTLYFANQGNAMSTMNEPPIGTNKSRARAELERLTANYDGPITRKGDPARVTLACTGCGHRRRIAVDFLGERPRCLRCGAGATVEP
jgi:hypothetical protein